MHNKLSRNTLFELFNYLLPILCETGLTAPTALLFFLGTGGARKPSIIDDMKKYYISKIYFAGKLLKLTTKCFLLVADSYKYYLKNSSLTGLSILLSASEYH